MFVIQTTSTSTSKIWKKPYKAFLICIDRRDRTLCRSALYGTRAHARTLWYGSRNIFTFPNVKLMNMCKCDMWAVACSLVICTSRFTVRVYRHRLQMTFKTHTAKCEGGSNSKVSLTDFTSCECPLHTGLNTCPLGEPRQDPAARCADPPSYWEPVFKHRKCVLLPIIIQV